MLKKSLLTLAVVPFTFGNFGTFSNPAPQNQLAQREMSLDNRHAVEFVNDVFKNNILLNLAYLDGRITSSKDINWDEITKPFQYEFKLLPNKTFAFHEDVKDKYKEALVKTTNAHFNAADGFKTDGYLFGDGICHLASLINWAAQDAGLAVEAPTNHDFAPIPDVPKKYGVSIYSSPFSEGSNALQNLYITNNRKKEVIFKFEYRNNKVSVAIVEAN